MIRLAFILPKPSNDLCFTRHGPKLSFEVEQRVDNDFVGNRLQIIKPLGQKDFETPQ